ncbi:MAG: hypothetical protein Q8N78_10345 [Sulfurimonas sp.]|nr:hypothetical protein [Sulfurimonas sp.]
MQVAVNFENDGVEVIKLDTADDEIINNFKDGLNEIHLINQGKLNSRPIQEFLNEL